MPESGSSGAISAVSARRILDGELDCASAEEKTAAACLVIRRTSALAAALAVGPIPLLDAMVIMPIQRRMVHCVARLRGLRIADAEVLQLFNKIRGRMLLTNLKMAATKLIPLVPVLPGLWSGAMAYAQTTAIGEVSDEYFCSNGSMTPLAMSASFDARFASTYRDAYAAGRSQAKAMLRNPDIRREMREIARAYRDGAIAADELARRSEEILSRP
jgi:uncharacterized protein (DUF697 family)